MSSTIQRLHHEIDRVGKPREVEGVLDLYLIRPSGYLIARAVYPTAIGPNTLSVLAVLTGWISAWGFFRAASTGNLLPWPVVAALAMLAHSAFDSANGQLARWRGEASEIGRLIDGLCDYLTFLAIYLSIGAGLAVYFGEHKGWFMTAAVAGALSHALQCALVEYQRNLYRFRVHGTRMPEAEDPVAAARRLLAESEGAMRWVHRVHLGYATLQQALCASSLELGRKLERLDRRDVANRAVPLIRRHQQRLLPFWAMLAPNSHKVMMVVAAFLPVAGFVGWAGLGMVWYLIYVLLLLNGFLVIMVLWQRRVDGEIVRRLDSEAEA